MALKAKVYSRIPQKTLDVVDSIAETSGLYRSDAIAFLVTAGIRAITGQSVDDLSNSLEKLKVIKQGVEY